MVSIAVLFWRDIARLAPATQADKAAQIGLRAKVFYFLNDLPRRRRKGGRRSAGGAAIFGFF